MIKIRISLILLSLFIAGLSFGQVYKWVDEKGVVHFTDDFSQIPEKYKRGIKEIPVQEERIETKTEEESPPKKGDDTYRDRLGRGEEYWKARVNELRKRMQDLQGNVENLRLKYNELTERFNSSKSSYERVTLRNDREKIKAQMDQYRSQIEEAKETLEKKIPEEAELYKAKPEWLKP
jgi:predicted  nucleic acid-binding Zn-ribbon protein